MTKPNADPTYTMGRSEEETERLISQSLLYEGITLEERLKQEVKAAKRPLLLPPHVTAYAPVG